MSPRRVLSGAVTLLLLGLLAAGCTSVRTPTVDPGTSPAGPVFLVQGIWADNEDWWVDDVEMELRRQGVEGIAVPYFCFVPGYLFGYGTVGPADRLTVFHDVMLAQHQKTRCQAELTFRGIGYSAGTEVLMKAAMRGVVFEQVWFAGSPIPLWSSSLNIQLREDRIKKLVNYYSPLDLLVWMSFGSGLYGFHAGGPVQHRVENRRHWRMHFFPLWDDAETVRAVVDEIVRQGANRTPHTCYREAWYREWYVAAKEALRKQRYVTPRRSGSSAPD